MRRHWTEILIKLACVTAFWIMYSCKCSCVAFWTTYDCNGRILAHIVTLRTMAVSIRQFTLDCKCTLGVDTYWTKQGCTYSTHWLHFVLCLLWLQVLGQCMAVRTNSFPPSWTMYDCMCSMATFWTLCRCKYSGQAGRWVQVFIGHNLHNATCKCIY